MKTAMHHLALGFLCLFLSASLCQARFNIGLCSQDSQCGLNEYCEGGCFSRLLSGAALDNLMNGGICTADVGKKYCVAGVCDTNDNRCGYSSAYNTPTNQFACEMYSADGFGFVRGRGGKPQLPCTCRSSYSPTAPDLGVDGCLQCNIKKHNNLVAFPNGDDVRCTICQKSSSGQETYRKSGHCLTECPNAYDQQAGSRMVKVRGGLCCDCGAPDQCEGPRTCRDDKPSSNSCMTGAPLPVETNCTCVTPNDTNCNGVDTSCSCR